MAGGWAVLGIWFGWLAIAAVILFFLITVRLELTYQYVNNHDHLGMAISLPVSWVPWCLEITFDTEELWRRIYSYLLILVKEEADEKNRDKDDGTFYSRGKFHNPARVIYSQAIDYGQYWMGIAKAGFYIWEKFLQRIICQRCRLFIGIGTGNPASSAILYGTIWMLLAKLYRDLRHQMQVNLKKPDLNVQARLNSSGWRIDFDCIFYLRLGHIISIGLSFLKSILIIIWKTRRCKKNARTSY